MDLRSTLSAVADYIPGDVENVLAAASAYLPDDLEKAISGAASYIPTEISLGSTVQFMLFFAAASLILGFMGRVFLGKRSSLNHSLSAAMGILFIYAVAIVSTPSTRGRWMRCCPPCPLSGLRESICWSSPFSGRR